VENTDSLKIINDGWQEMIKWSENQIDIAGENFGLGTWVTKERRILLRLESTSMLFVKIPNFLPRKNGFLFTKKIYHRTNLIKKI
jgi:hypothetical protein